MPIATDPQVQAFSDNHVRQRCQQIQALYVACKSDKALFDDIYAALTQQNPTWHDTNGFNPPHFLTVENLLAWNTFISGIIALMENGSSQDMVNAQAQVPVVLSAVL